MIELGVKSDPIEYRYSFNWLFDLLVAQKIKYVQIGSFFELYNLDDNYFNTLRQEAENRDLIIKSVFTAHRELGGFFVNNRFMEKAARKSFERLIHVASILGADYCGSNPGAVYRDQIAYKDRGIACYLSHMKELSYLAKEKGLKALTMESMSCMAEPPSTPAEIDYMISMLHDHHSKHRSSTVPVYLCGDISHGLANANMNIVYTNMQLFEHGIPVMSEFHFKNTDQHFNSTFGFSEEEMAHGIVDLNDVKDCIARNLDKFPVKDVVGYLEIAGPKTGRDYSDPHLKEAIRSSLKTITAVFDENSLPEKNRL